MNEPAPRAIAARLSAALAALLAAVSAACVDTNPPQSQHIDARAADATPAGDDAGLLADDAEPMTTRDAAAMGDDDATTPAAPDVPPFATRDAAPMSAPDAAPVDAGAASGDCAGARLCEDFEAYAAGGPPRGPWTTSLIGGTTAAVDETRARSGRRSVRLTTPGATPFHRAYVEVTGAPLFPLPGGVMWGRMMMWLTAGPPGATHWTNIEAEGPVSGRAGVRALYRYGGQFDRRIMANYDTRGARTDCWDHSTTTIPEGRWACFEWRFDSTADRLELWIDGAPLSDVTVNGMGEGCLAHELQDRWAAPTFDTLRLGWEHYQASAPIEMWIDDVAVDGSRIGCP